MMRNDFQEKLHAQRGPDRLFSTEIEVVNENKQLMPDFASSMYAWCVLAFGCAELEPGAVACLGKGEPVHPLARLTELVQTLITLPLLSFCDGAIHNVVSSSRWTQNLLLQRTWQQPTAPWCWPWWVCIWARIQPMSRSWSSVSASDPCPASHRPHPPSWMSATSATDCVQMLVAQQMLVWRNAGVKSHGK